MLPDATEIEFLIALFACLACLISSLLILFSLPSYVIDRGAALALSILLFLIALVAALILSR